MKHTVKDVLRMAGHLLADPKRHCVDTVARTKDGRAVNWNDPQAAQWCLIGAICVSKDRLGVYYTSPSAMTQAETVIGCEDWCGIGAWNSGSVEERLAIAAKLRSA